MKTKIKEYKYYYIYKTTNLINERFYIGRHSTNNLEDGYLGSGSIIKQAINKYGINNFKCEVLEFCKSIEDVIKREEEIVTADFIQNPLCYNAKPGGGNNYVVTVAWTDERKQQQRERISGENNPIFGRNRTDKEKAKISKNHANVSGENNPMYNKIHSEDTRNKISITRIEKIKNGEITFDLSKMNERKQCPHCKKITNLGNLNRWHFEKCKFKDLQLDVS